MAEKTEIAIEATALSYSGKSMSAGAIAGAVGWASQVNWLGLIGAAVAIIGLAVNFYFQMQRNKREVEMHKARMDEIRERCGSEK